MAEGHQFEIRFLESVLQREPDHVEILEMLAGYYTRDGHIRKGLALDLRLVDLEPGNATHHYNLACSLALSGDTQAALDVLRTAIDKGYRDHHWMMKDPDLKVLRNDPGFLDMVAELEIADEPA